MPNSHHIQSTFSVINPPDSSSANPNQKSNGWSKTYLIAYNLASATAWSIVLDRLLFNSLLTTNLPTSLLEISTRASQAHLGLNTLLILVQSSALLEILHAALGIVRSGLLTTVMQVASRLLVVWLILPIFPTTAHSPIYASMVLAWSLSEIIRYGTYASSLLNYPFRPLLWLRYSAFYVLYPIGAGSEWGLIYLASKMAKESDHESMTGLSYFLSGALAIWPPALVVMMQHMSSQRKKFIKTHFPQLKNSPQKQE